MGQVSHELDKVAHKLVQVEQERDQLAQTNLRLAAQLRALGIEPEV